MLFSPQFNKYTNIAIEIALIYILLYKFIDTQSKNITTIKQ